ncbi:hypothetical protein J3R30DRAFT_3445524 [Lentinula aciculospora]|uniref:Uncharacterized protein n=1 Tax=Lentinula aciculospora TaxID=153920 RepID=A0A9W9AM76_9AGAR|nr:hypothetical protein J3R30DRAFT_3445524 [Lentinula aciculospora]
MEAETPRPLLAPSYSFSGSSAASSTFPRSLKRTLTSSSDLDFFKPAESSFNPRPYAPSANPPSSSHSKNRYPQLPRSNRPEAHVIPPASMDPSPTDPNTIFIHPPFTNFPDAQSFPEGLTYKVMAENPDWFLDASDYVRVEDSPTNAPVSDATHEQSLVPYPSNLEPPRGWCPTKKKDLKDLGSEGWPDGEEPRLRCTFCRRTYAGVNAKSMWRRHVFEKHKIAMSNRRDSGDRPRGRGSTKENKPTSKLGSVDGIHDKPDNIHVTPQPFVRDTSQTQQKIRFRPAIMGDPMKPFQPASVSPTASSTENLIEEGNPSLFTPPLTPLRSSSAPVSGLEDVVQTSTPPAPMIPPSPYDPQATPAFRHSPAPTPYDQPWRYPSPSHPFSKARDLSLSVLLRNSGSLTVDSPGPVPSLMRDDISSPSSSLVSKKSFFVDLDTPGSIMNKRLTGLKNSASGRPNFSQESPLRRGLVGRGHHRNSSDLSLDEWLSLPIAPDPFLNTLNGWDSENNSSPIAHGLMNPVINPTESPVVRREITLDRSGLGIGLLEPFTLPGSRSHTNNDSSSDIEDEFEIMDDLTSSRSNTESGYAETITPPPKKRRTSAL